MGDQKLHPSVEEFKQFVNKHPKLIANLRKKGRPWQEYYEKWVLLGEDDDYWEVFKERDGDNKHKARGDKDDSNDADTKKKNTELFSKFMKMAENVDMDKVQKQVHQLSNTISTVQEAINDFQQTKGSSSSRPNPYQWYQD